MSDLEKKLIRALRELLEQIDCLDGIEFSSDVELYKAEACWDDAYNGALKVLREATP